jgi:hypothetical protein
LVDTFFSRLLEPASDIRDDDPTNAPQLYTERLASFARLLRIVSGCWIAYIGLLYLLNGVLVALTPQIQLLPPMYSLLNAGAALIVFDMAISIWAQRRMGRALQPTVIICLLVLPLRCLATRA